MANITKNTVRKLLSEQGQGFNCEGTCECVTPVFGTGTYQTVDECIQDSNCCKRWDCYSDGAGVCEAVNNPLATFANEQDCLNAYPTGCLPRPDTFDCLPKTGYVCANLGPSGGGQFTSMGDCQLAFPDGCAPDPDDYNCVPHSGGFQCVVQAGGPFTGPTAQADCNAAVAAGIAPCNVPDQAYTCDLDNCVCIPDASGPFTGPTAQADCTAALSNPNHECCCINCGEMKYNFIRKTSPPPGGDGPGKDGPGKLAPVPGREDWTRAQRVAAGEVLSEQTSSTMACVGFSSGQPGYSTAPFTSMAACNACVNDPQCKQCNRRDDPGAYDCLHGQGGCQPIAGGQYSSLADCEAGTDDHYNWNGGGDFCHCDCPGQPAGCDAANLYSPVPIINMEFEQNGGQGFGGTLDLNHDQDSQGPLISQAFRTRMAPCGPSYNAPGGNVKHDCKFWEYISTKKLPIDVWNNKVMVANPQSTNPWHMQHGQYPWVQGPGPGGQATTSTGLGGWITNQGTVLNPLGSGASSTPHPRWQRRIEAKIAYVRCLRAACCKDTKWPNDGQVFTPTL